ncbi:hypothetical protein PACTADRAFT_51909 [Pachysolen tannophilus NRRL Y-2460]|uniref:Clathrin/coatomer adaptor adaptin-like N-terminal domain-containing protein n=1 Tax=Pachysolen tannophilus NRRL Y-2460 TaxID=669874 RepID=A0A1E4TNF6_PACTA|nr:hypothetical protein PACTADRAFT_51909 [Pachysolen tannophilus NRRL Y-2460]
MNQPSSVSLSAPLNLAMKPEEIIKLLNSRADKEKLNGLKVIMALMSSNKQDENYLVQFFPDVIKNVSSTNLNIKKLVYIYLSRFNYLSPDTALLSINAIQKSILDQDPVIRSLSIRIISNIKIAAIIPILVLSIKKCLSDLSSLVRSSVCIAISKTFELELQFNGPGSATLKQLIDFLKTLLSDNDNKVLNSAIITFHQILSNNLEILHGYFHHFIKKLPELENWSQVLLIDLLTNYCKKFISKPSNLEIEQEQQQQEVEDYNGVKKDIIDPDLMKFLNSMKLLAYSNSSAVILAVAKAFINLAPTGLISNYKIHLSLLKLLNKHDPYLNYYILQEIYLLTILSPMLYEKTVNHFFLFPRDKVNVSILKLKILTNLISEQTKNTILRELKYYSIHSSSLPIKLQAIKSILISCSKLSHLEDYQSSILKWCLSQLNNNNVKDKQLIDEYLACIRFIIQKNPSVHLETLLKLSSKLIFNSSRFNYSSKSSIIWLLGEFLNLNLLKYDEYLPDILRMLILQTFIKHKHNEFNDDQENQYYNDEGELAEGEFEANSRIRSEILLLSSKLWCKELYQWKLDNESLLNNYQQRKQNPQAFENADELFVSQSQSTLSSQISQLVANSTLLKLYSYVLYLTRFDDSLDIRNSSRKFDALLPSLDLTNISNFDEDDFLEKLLNNIDICSLILQAEKPVPRSASSLEDKLGSVNHILKYDPNLDSFLKAYNKTFHWTSTPISDSVRNYEVIVKDYSNVNTGISSAAYNKNNNTFNPSSSSTGFGNTDLVNGKVPERFNRIGSNGMNRSALSSSSGSSVTAGAAKKYHLQSLDEFFGNDDEGEEDEEDEEDEDDDDDDEEDDEEGEEEEEEDDDDESDEEEVSDNDQGELEEAEEGEQEEKESALGHENEESDANGN